MGTCFDGSGGCSLFPESIQTGGQLFIREKLSQRKAYAEWCTRTDGQSFMSQGTTNSKGDLRQAFH